MRATEARRHRGMLAGALSVLLPSLLISDTARSPSASPPTTRDPAAAPPAAPPGTAEPAPAPRLLVGPPASAFALPDLRFTDFELTGEVELVESRFEIPVVFTVTNSGRARSAPCKVRAHGVAAAGPFPLMLRADRQSSPYDAAISALEPNESRTLTGRVEIQRDLGGSRVAFFLVVDDPATDEFGTGAGTVRELDESNNESRRASVQLPFWIDRPLTAAAAPAQVARRSQPERWTLGVRRVRLDRLSENGDEPYFLTFGFRAKLGRPGSASVVWQGDVGEFVVDARRGRDLAAPAWMARVDFENVRRLTWEEHVADVDRIEFLGLVVVALEHDASDFDDLRRLARRAVEPLRQGVERLLAEARIPLADSDAAIAAATDRIRHQVEPTTREIVFRVWESTIRLDKLPEVVDADDFIGTGVLVVAAIEEDYGLVVRDGPMPAPRLRSFDDWTLRFRGTAADPCDWTVTLFASTPRKIVR